MQRHKLVDDAMRNSRKLDESGGVKTIPKRFVVKVQEIGDSLVESQARVVVKGLDDQFKNVHVGIALYVTMRLLTVHVIFHVVVDKLTL